VKPYDGYLSDVKKICEKYNVLLILDEVQTGMGRSGKMMCFQHEEGLKPDIVTVAKSISGGAFPVSGVLADAHVMDLIGPGEHGSTFGGCPIGMATANAALSVLVDEKMPENAAAMGIVMNERLSKIAAESPVVKHHRWGRGLFHAFIFDDKLEKDGFEFIRILRENGVLTRINWRWYTRFFPPLNITEG
jgi:ornithine--oxo-acid transaminase